MMTLYELREWFLSLKVGAIRPVEFRNSGNRCSTVLHREPPYGVELIVWQPGCVVPVHHHPNMESLVESVNGDGVLLLGETEEEAKKKLERASFWPARKLRSKLVHIPAGAWHGGKTGDTGMIFYSFQKWSGQVEQSVAGQDWKGPALPTPNVSRFSHETAS